MSADSDTDSEADRRAYGQYPSLGLDSDVDEEAAAYLRAVRAEARALPDVVTVPLPDDDAASSPELDGHDGKNGDSSARQPADGISASPEWVRSFMKDFLDVRLKLQSLELQPGTSTPAASEAVPKGPDGGEQPDAAAPVGSLTDILSLDQAEVGALLEDRIDRVATKGSLSSEDAYGIFALAAVLEHPPLADAEAAFGALLRHCRRLRARSEASGVAAACLDILQVLAGAYFGQDAALRAQFHEHGTHV